MNKLFAVIAATVLSTTLILAKPPAKGPVKMQMGSMKGGMQARNGPGMHRGGRSILDNKELMKKLKLTAAQKKKVQAADKTLMDSFMKARDPKADRETMMKKGRAMMEKHDKTIAGILNASQKKVYSAFKKEQKAKFDKMRKEGRFGGIGGPGGPGGMGRGGPGGPPPKVKK